MSSNPTKQASSNIVRHNATVTRAPRERKINMTLKDFTRKRVLGKITEFTGISSPAPATPELSLKTGIESLDVCIQEIMNKIASLRIVTNRCLKQDDVITKNT